MKFKIKPKNFYIFLSITIIVILYLIFRGLIHQIIRYRTVVSKETFLPYPEYPVQHISVRRKPTRFINSDIKILCMILTAPKYHKLKAVHVKATWAQHCNKTVFLSSEDDPILGNVIVAPDAEGYQKLWQKVSIGFKRLSEEINKYDWLVKADDDTFLVIEHLKLLLTDKDPNQLYATGLLLNNPLYGKFLSGGAAYVMTREVVKRLSNSLEDGGTCTAEGGMQIFPAEDINTANCMRRLGVTILNSRDENDKQRFNVFPPTTVMDPRKSYNLEYMWLKLMKTKYNFGLSEMSPDVISFHYIDAETMYLLYYLVYLVNPIGREMSLPAHSNYLNKFVKFPGHEISGLDNNTNILVSN